MIHIATVHWKTDKWIDIQLDYLKKHIQSEYRVYAFLNDVPDEHVHKFYYVSTEPIEEHAIKLNLLAERISWEANEDDLIIFLDGDAFPISDEVIPFVKTKIRSHKLVAIQRREILGDIQPHPSFCATTIGFWNLIVGDWKMGHMWKDKTGLSITDVGGNLLLRLIKSDTKWFPLFRSNVKNIHPVWFGVYGNLIYHHGAGFREPYGRVDREGGGFKIFVLFRLSLFFRSLVALIEQKLEKAEIPIIEMNQKSENLFFNKIETNPFFYKDLL